MTSRVRNIPKIEMFRALESYHTPRDCLALSTTANGGFPGIAAQGLQYING